MGTQAVVAVVILILIIVVALIMAHDMPIAQKVKEKTTPGDGHYSITSNSKGEFLHYFCQEYPDDVQCFGRN